MQYISLKMHSIRIEFVILFDFWSVQYALCFVFKRIPFLFYHLNECSFFVRSSFHRLSNIHSCLVLNATHSLNRRDFQASNITEYEFVFIFFISDFFFLESHFSSVFTNTSRTLFHHCAFKGSSKRLQTLSLHRGCACLLIQFLGHIWY